MVSIRYAVTDSLQSCAMGLSYPHIWGSTYTTIWEPPNPPLLNPSYPQLWSPPYPEIMVYHSLRYSVHGILRFVSSVIEYTIQGWCTSYPQKCGRWSTISSGVRSSLS